MHCTVAIDMATGGRELSIVAYRSSGGQVAIIIYSRK
jgi:hypothetical protein